MAGIAFPISTIAPKSFKSKASIIENFRPSGPLSGTTYDPNELEIIYSDTLSGMTYVEENGILKRRLMVLKSKLYDEDDLTSSRDWLLNNRQGDEYDRLPEYVLDQEAQIKQETSMIGELTSN